MKAIILLLIPFISFSQCDIEKATDKFTKSVYYVAPAIDFDQASIYLSKEKGKVLFTVALRKVRTFCITKSSTLSLLFTDQSILKIHHTDPINCSGNFISNQSPLVLKAMANKTIEAIKIEGPDNIEQFDLEQAISKRVKDNYTCLINK